MADSEKTKILYIITKSNFGGAQKYVYDLSTNLDTKRFNVVVAMGGNGVLKDKLDRAGIKTIVLDKLSRDVNTKNDIAVFFELLELFKKEMPDIVHLNSSKTGGLGAFTGRVYNILSKINLLKSENHKLKKYRPKTTIIFTAHGWAFNEARGGTQRILIKLLSWVTIFLCHRVIAVSEHDERQGRAMPLVGNKVVMVHNGISEIDFKNKEEARDNLLGNSAHGLREDAIFVGTIAEVHKNKGIFVAIKALMQLATNSGKDRPFRNRKGRSFPEFALVIIGEGEERENLEKFVKECGLNKNVFFVGHKENASSLLKAFDIFLLSSFKEGLPYVLLEAGMAKLPIVASEVGGIPEIIDDMESGVLIKTNNAEEIAKAIAYLTENKENMKKLGRNIHEKIAKKFSTDQMLEKTMKIYQI